MINPPVATRPPRAQGLLALIPGSTSLAFSPFGLHAPTVPKTSESETGHRQTDTIRTPAEAAKVDPNTDRDLAQTGTDGSENSGTGNSHPAV
jgi:hypothetical protein